MGLWWRNKTRVSYVCYSINIKSSSKKLRRITKRNKTTVKRYVNKSPAITIYADIKSGRLSNATNDELDT